MTKEEAKKIARFAFDMATAFGCEATIMEIMANSIRRSPFGPKTRFCMGISAYVCGVMGGFGGYVLADSFIDIVASVIRRDEQLAKEIVKFYHEALAARKNAQEEAVDTSTMA